MGIPKNIASATNSIMDSSSSLTIQSVIEKFVVAKFPAYQAKELKPSDSLIGTSVIDSFAILDLVEMVETEFKLTIEDVDLLPENFDSIEAITAFVERKQSL